jgi:uncharacterized protein HemX
MKTSKEAGSHLLVVALVLLVIGVVGFAGWRVWQMQQTLATATSGATDTATVPSKITNTATLDQASKALDQSSTQVNANLDDNGLNSDLNDML